MARGELFRLRVRFTRTWDERDRIMALYGPIALLSLPFVWLVLVLTGYTSIFWSLAVLVSMVAGFAPSACGPPPSMA